MTDFGSLRARLDACVHCGLCLPACPTYGVTANELDGPRGRIDLVRGLVEGDLADPATATRHLDRCLGCRACETACPSGVRYGEILESARGSLGAARPPSSVAARALRAFSSPGATLWALRAAWFARRTGLAAVARALPGRLGAAARVLPDARWMPWSREVGLTAGERVLSAAPPRRGTVALLPGCVMDQAFAGVHDASAALLRAGGFDVLVPRGPLCCGALHAHVGQSATASSLAEGLAAAIPQEVGGRPVDALVVDAAGCGSHLKETPGPWRGRTADVLEWLDRHGFRAPLHPVAARFGRPAGTRLRIAYADPCHLLHAQRVAEAPRRLLAAIPDVDLVPLRDADRCCGSAGVFNLAQPELADELLRRKVECLAEAAPHLVATANPGCQLQIAAGLREAGSGLAAIPVRHVVEVLAAAVFPGADPSRK